MDRKDRDRLTGQLNLFEGYDEDELAARMTEVVLAMLHEGMRHGPGEFLLDLERAVGWRARLHVQEVVRHVQNHPSLKREQREYIASVLSENALRDALRGNVKPDREFRSTIDDLLRRGAIYRESSAYAGMLKFVAKFRDYSPFNNMLVRLQNPACQYFATERDWARRFKRDIKDDARPMLILAPMHPVMTVFDLDSVRNPPLPEHLVEWTTTRGDWDPRWLERTVANAAREGVLVEFKTLSTALAGFATRARESSGHTMRIAVHDGLDDPSRYAVLCHELAHIYLGHLGTDAQSWWPCRTGLTHATVEIEAESVAYVVTARLGLELQSERYLAAFAHAKGIPETVSVELVSKIAGRLEDMARRTVTPRIRKPPRGRGERHDGEAQADPEQADD